MDFSSLGTSQLEAHNKTTLVVKLSHIS